MKKLFVGVILSLVLIAGAQANQSQHKQPRPTVRVGFVEFPPLFSTDQQGHPHGLLINLLRQVLTDAGYDATFFSYPTKRMTTYLIEGKIDLWLGVAAVAETDKVLVSDTKVMTIKLQAYHVGDKPSIKSKSDLNHQTIAVIRGYSYGGWISYIKDPVNNITVIEASTHSAGLSLLKIGRVDYLLDYKTPIDATLDVFELPNLVASPLSAVPVQFVISKQYPHAQQLLELLEASYLELKAQGRL